MDVSHQVSPASLPAVCAHYSQRTLVAELRMITAQMGNAQ
jgi:hypothetical protein